MNNDDSRGNYNSYQHRKPNPHKNSYSPSANYYGNNGYNNQQHSQNSQHPQQQQRRRPPNKGNFNNNDRLIKQNDIIISLLKEIRDRLPAPSVSENPITKVDECNTAKVNNEQTSTPENIPMTTENKSNEDNADSECQETPELATAESDKSE